MPVGRVLVLVGMGVHLVGALMLTVAEHRFFQSAADLADQVHARYPAGGSFTGEWSFRWRMDAHGWRFYTGDAPSGAIVAAPTNSSPGAVPEGWRVLDGIETSHHDGLRVVHDSLQIGLYAETLGALPVGWASGPMEEVTLWQVP